MLHLIETIVHLFRKNEKGRRRAAFSLSIIVRDGKNPMLIENRIKLETERRETQELYSKLKPVWRFKPSVY